MAQVINTNSLSLLTQNNLNKSQSQLNTAIQRLSSGLRINSAKDDAAGQAIANRFTANIKGLTQATRNANDGISIAQTTEGALTEVNNNLQRVRELSVQAANGTNSPSDLKSIQAEIQQRMDEINRVSEQTQFNGVKVLSSEAGRMSIQVGANDGQTIDINLQQIDQRTLGLGNLDITKTGLDLSKVATAATTTLTPASTGATTTVQLRAVDSQAAPTYSVYVDDADADKLYVSDGTNYYDVTGYDNATGKLEFDATTPLGAAPTATEVTAGQEISVGGGVTVDADTVGFDGGTPPDAPEIFVDAAGDFYVSRDSGATAISATFDAATGDVTYDSDDWASAAAVADLSSALTDYEIPPVAQPAVTANLAGLSADSVGSSPSLHKVTGVEGLEYVVKGEKNGADVYYKANVAGDGTVTLGEQFNTDPLAAIDAALAKVDDLRSSLGAVQNRFDSTIANLGTTITNLSSSRSRIEDADYAVEVSNMTRAQILQQAGTSVLAQANQTTQGVLSLLR